MLSNDENDDSFGDVFFFGAVTEKELEIASKLNNATIHESSCFYNRKLTSNEDIQELSCKREQVSPDLSSSQQKSSDGKAASESNLSHLDLQMNHDSSIDNISNCYEYYKFMSTPVVNISQKDPLAMNDSLEQLSINDNAILGNENSKTEEDYNLGVKSIEKSHNESIMPSENLSLNFNCVHGKESIVSVEDSNEEQRNVDNTKHVSDALEEEESMYCQSNDNKILSSVLDKSCQSPVNSQGICNDKKSPKSKDSCLTCVTNYKDESILAFDSTYPSELSNKSDIDINCPKTVKMSLSFSKSESYYEQNFKEKFDPRTNIPEGQLNVPSLEVEPAKQNYFDTLALIDISSECDDISEGNMSYELGEQFECLTEKSISSEPSYVSDGTQNYAIILSNSEGSQSCEQDSLPATNTVNKERSFNDTTEEMELLLKHEAKYFQEYNPGGKHGDLSALSQITVNESILSPRKESVSSINSTAFIPPYNSTHCTNDICEEATFAIGTSILPAIRAPPPKPPRNGKSPVVLHHRQSPIKTVKLDLTPRKHKRIPTYTLKPKAKSPRTPYNTPCIKSKYANFRPTCLTPLNKVAPAKPTSAISLFNSKSKLTPCQTKGFLTPQTKFTNYKPFKDYKSLTPSEPELLHKKIRGLSIVSPVAKYLQNNPPPPLITTVKPKNKMDPKFIEKVLSPVGMGSLKNSNMTPPGMIPKILERKRLLPKHSYTTSEAQILEKENIDRRREILTNNPPTSITKHIGRFKMPKNSEGKGASSLKDQSMMEISVCENKLVQHSSTLR